MTHAEEITGLLADLETITRAAQAGVFSKREVRLEPGETRPAAILFLDVVGFTGLARALTSQQLSTLIDRTFRIFELTVKGHGGYCDKVIGDAGLYVFAGHPNYPPPCEAALAAALKIQERARQVAESMKPMGLPVAIRVGVDFGEVTRQRVGGADAPFTVMGETVIVAQRLESTAKPGSIQTTIRVLDRAGDIFQHASVGSVELKGIGPVAVYEVTGVEPRPVTLRGSFRRLSPLIGRDEILVQAEDVIERWLATRYDPSTFDIATTSTRLTGRNRLMIFGGVAAVGKSRLAYELVERMRARAGVSTATAHCAESVSLRTFTAELAKVAGVDAANLPVRWESLCAHAARTVGEPYAERARRHLPLLALLLGCEEVDTSGIRQMDANNFMLGCKLALRACCELASHYTGKPVVVVVEDLQWMGVLFEVIADLLTNASLPQPLVVVATARPEYDHEDASLGEGEARVFQLAKLVDSDGKALMDALLPGLALPKQMEAELHEKAAGLPYYYEEFARMLVRSGSVAERDGRYELVRQLAGLELPEDIQMLILGRLDQLPQEMKELTMRASVLGRSFLRDLLAAIDRRLSLDSPEHPDDLLAELTSHHVLAREAGDRYFFEHVLTRDAAYSALLRVNRVALHGLAAEVLEELHVPGTAEEWDLLPELVRHLEATGRYLEAHKKCCGLFYRLVVTGRHADREACGARARRLWELARSADATLPAVSSDYLEALAIGHRLQGRMDEARECLEQAMAVAREAGDRSADVESYLGLGSVHSNQGRRDEARACYDRALAIAKEVGDREGEGGALNALGLLDWEQGQYDDARACYERALAVFRQTGDPQSDSSVVFNLGILEHEQGRCDEAQACYDQSLGVARQLGDRHLEGLVLNCIGVLHSTRGRRDDARLCYEQSIAIAREVGDVAGEADALSNLGELHSAQGRKDEARVLYEQALAIARRVKLPGIEGQVLGALGNWRRELGDLDGAREALSESIHLLEEVGAVTSLCGVHCYLAHYNLAVGDIEAARASLADAEQRAHRIGARPESNVGKAIAEARKAIEEFEQTQRESG